MASSKNYRKVLLVEGKTEKLVIPELIEQNGIEWINIGETIPYIHFCGGYEKLVEPEFIQAQLERRNLNSLGIIIDADENPANRWISIRNSCIREGITNLPDNLPERGLIQRVFIEAISQEVTFGIWMMPDNQYRGMLETFLAYLIPDDNKLLWDYAQETVQEARNKGATFTDVKQDKANIYTWLAWQNEPGRQLHQAINEKILNPNHPQSQVFFQWFKELFNLT
ncbi:MAG: DUF3226 domain-containing protein [Microcystaceae cyanobacterium]